MTENLPERREAEAYTPEPLPPVASPDTDSWTTKVAEIARLSEHIAGTEFVPKALRGKPAAVAAAILYGREVGLPPMTALTQTHVIEGAPSMSAEAMRAMVLAAGHKIEFRETTGAVCTVAGQRRGSSAWTEVTWTTDMARAAGLLGKDNWKNFPRRMLQARASSELCELLFPDVVHGLRATEEMTDAGAGEDQAEQQQTSPVQRQQRTPQKRGKKKTSGGPVNAETRDRAKDPHDADTSAEGTPAGPPLPGEAGYDQDPTVTSAEENSAESHTPDDAEPQSASGSASPDGGAADTAEGEAESAAPPEDQPDYDQAPDEPPPGPRMASKAQVQRLAATFNGFGVKDRAQRLSMLAVLVRNGQPVDSMNDLTSREASAAIDTLARCENAEQLQTVLKATGEHQGGES